MSEKPQKFPSRDRREFWGGEWESGINLRCPVLVKGKQEGRQDRR